MTITECEILQELKIIRLILEDIDRKAGIEDFFTMDATEKIEQLVKDLEYVFNGGK